MMSFSPDISYIINELGEERQQYFNAVSPPIFQTSNFAFSKVDDLREAFYNESSTYLYSRGINPTVDILRKKLAALDGAEDCLVFNSGAAAIFAAVVANVKAGAHIISVHKPYTWAQKIFNHMLTRFNVSTTYVDGTDTQNFADAIKPNTVLIYLESPNSWNYQLQDLEKVAALAKTKNIITICDNSYCTPLFQKPLAFGIDMTVQSATKYIGGHSDTIAGVLCGTKDMIAKIFNLEYLAIGSGIQPYNAWLMIRGLRTLPLRLEKSASNTYKVVAFLKNHPKVKEVLFPLDPTFPQIELAKKQMKDACGLITFILNVKTLEAVNTFCESLQHILMAVSWGGYESLIIPACAGIQPQSFNPGKREHLMIRLYVGLEEPDYIINDLQQALSKLDDVE